MCVVLLASIVFYQNVHSINSTPAGVLTVLEFELSLCLRGREGAHDQVKLIIAEEGWGGDASASKSAVVLRWRGVCIGSLALCCRLQSLKTSSDGDSSFILPYDVSVTIQTLSVPSLSSTSRQSRTVIDNMT